MFFKRKTPYEKEQDKLRKEAKRNEEERLKVIRQKAYDDAYQKGRLTRAKDLGLKRGKEYKPFHQKVGDGLARLVIATKPASPPRRTVPKPRRRKYKAPQPSAPRTDPFEAMLGKDFLINYDPFFGGSTEVKKKKQRRK